MTAEELKGQAVRQRHRMRVAGDQRESSPVTFYFDADDCAIGYTRETPEGEEVCIYDTPHTWSPDVKALYVATEL